MSRNTDYERKDTASEMTPFNQNPPATLKETALSNIPWLASYCHVFTI